MIAWYALHKLPISPESAYRFESKETPDPARFIAQLRQFYDGTGIDVEEFESEEDFKHAARCKDWVDEARAVVAAAHAAMAK